MNIRILKAVSAGVLSFLCLFVNPVLSSGQASETEYLDIVKVELKKQWPANKTINLVFHGHSVPSGYFKTPDVRTLEAYPHQVLRQLKQLYPTAVINVIVTAIGGENSIQGSQRFEEEVLVHRPDVLFIDYALNDRALGLEQARKATEQMIRTAMHRKIPLILLTPSPDLQVSLTSENNVLAQFAAQIRTLADEYQIGLADSYVRFKMLATNGEDISGYMAQSNHPNEKGHALIADEILKFFK